MIGKISVEKKSAKSGWDNKKRKNLPTVWTTSSSFIDLRAISGTGNWSGIASVLRGVGLSMTEAEGQPQRKKSPILYRLLE